MPSPKIILVFAATGLQGSALTKALSAQNTPTVRYDIRALTRSAASPSAQKLAALPGVKVVEVPKDHMDKPAQVFEQLGLAKGSVHGVFSNQGYVDDQAMERQGKAIAEASQEYDVKHLVYSSVAGENTGIDAWEVKHEVERYIKTLGVGYTLLRPVQFMDNLLPDRPFLFKVVSTVLLSYTYRAHPERKHQVIATEDIGRAAAEAFVRGPQWMGGVVDLAGDEMTVADIDKVFKEELGHPVRQTYGFLARLVMAVVPIVRQQATFFDKTGTQVDISSLQREIPELRDLRTFLREYKARQ